jgi:hypothetical protein
VVTPGHVDNLAGRVKFGDNKTMRSAKQAEERRTKMAVAEVQASPQAAQDNTWHGIVLASLKRNDIRLVPYVPDRVPRR